MVKNKLKNLIIQAGDHFEEVDPWFYCANPHVRTGRKPRVVQVKNLLCWNGVGYNTTLSSHDDYPSYVTVVVGRGRGKGSVLSLPVSQIADPNRWKVLINYTPPLVLPEPLLVSVTVRYRGSLPTLRFEGVWHHFPRTEITQRRCRSATVAGCLRFIQKARAGGKRGQHVPFGCAFVLANNVFPAPEPPEAPDMFSYEWETVKHLNSTGLTYQTILENKFDLAIRYATEMLEENVKKRVLTTEGAG